MPTLPPSDPAVRPLGRLLDLVRKLREILADVPISVILGLIQDISDLADLPDPDDEQEVLRWVTEILDAADTLAGLTEVQFDDAAVDVARQVVASEFGWSLLYPAIQAALKNLPFEPLPASMVDEEQLPGIDPATIMAIIAAVIELVKMIRELRK